MNYTFIVILFISVIVVGIFSEILNKKIHYFNKYIIPFSLSFVLALIFLHILPELYHSSTKSIGLYFILGFVLQIIIELLSKGIEHGHVHAPEHHKGWTLLLPLMIGLSLHSFIEGMPLVSIDSIHEGHHHTHSHAHPDPDTGYIYFIMIIVHKLPVAAILMVFFMKHIIERWKRYALLCFFALTAPIGAIVGFTITNNESTQDVANILLAISTGMLLHIATLLVFEKHHEQKEKWSNILLIISGLLLGVVFYY